MNSFFSEHNFEELKQETINDIIICCISILQETSLEKDNTSYGRLIGVALEGSIGLYADIDLYSLFSDLLPNRQDVKVFLQVPVIVVRANTSLKSKTGKRFDKHPFHLERQNGKFVLKFN